MKIISKLFLLIVVLMLVNLTAEAQDKKMESSYTIGFLVNHENLGYSMVRFEYGGHLGVNLYSANTKRLKADFQFSMNLSGGDTFISINALGGGRYYILDSEQSPTIFINLLLGGAYIFEEGDDFTEHLFDIGYSAGCFIDMNKFTIGVAAESYNNFIFKIGYSF